MLAGIAFLLGAVLYGPWLVSLAVGAVRSRFHEPGVRVPAPGPILGTRLTLLATGAAFLAASWTIGRIGALDRWFRRPRVENVLLTVLVVAVPVGWLEVSLRPFLPPAVETTSIFLRDDRLGWRLRPNAVDLWGGVEVRINERGLRGPLVPYAKAPGTRRVVYLGDSVTFGYRAARWEDTFPFVADALVASGGAGPVETVNLSVDGYSQWQEEIVLKDEGLRYDPDLVVVGFVLNDVTEMFHLVRFGGTRESWQVRHARRMGLDRWLAKSAIVYVTQSAVRNIEARRRFGDDVQLGAIHEEELNVRTLILKPDQPNVTVAWDRALADMQKIADDCAARKIPLLIAVFPFATQLTDPDHLSAPQHRIMSYAKAHGLAAVDLLPAMAAHLRETGAPPSELFVDGDHLSVEGHRLVAEVLRQPIAESLTLRTPSR